jgi:hypothetical protein
MCEQLCKTQSSAHAGFQVKISCKLIKTTKRLQSKQSHNPKIKLVYFDFLSLPSPLPRPVDATAGLFVSRLRRDAGFGSRGSSAVL